ncbi:bifunctional DNA-formamidopyrimidine glycosylase/DNA-(apurinic or apyrimidinic site) lyase [Limoniibacter endophyticus]|uniref:Formamidopyrimidine-DNA glycosylase n=1 Tax=Limoniibacter endophyticus TaxID=1565040 RepID=A0A8J3DGB0_9HYPH|nr:bifunctional DNA-formamidopyrimidine glycosylase/DNA-(apurinic or apyrimidinic site) lyase [Limoniibacter endophyticus]GHC67098.1 formamidopyrimidine-DNA glycosylase [Limoniibacter endophyticus]
MPELPEVETVRRGLQPAMEGRLIERLELRRKDLRFPFPEGLADAVEGHRISALARRAKYLLIHLEKEGSPSHVLISHLGMSGSYRIETNSNQTPGEFYHERSKLAAHDHVVFHLSDGEGKPLRVIYNDPRRFGFLLMSAPALLHDHPLLRSLGMEPTGNALDGAFLKAGFAGRRSPAKTTLLDQKLISGLGNIYVCEALWRARLSPIRSAASIATGRGSTDRCEVLATAIRDVIADAIAAGGSSLRDHIQTDGTMGYFQHNFAVYDREGKACRHEGCSGTISRITQAGRSTFYCPACQQ